MEHVLNNPAWNALISGNKQLSIGNEEVKYFADDVSPFAAFKNNTSKNFLQLNELVSLDRVVLFVTPVKINIPDCWKILNCVKGVQMVNDVNTCYNEDLSQLVALTDEHIPQMLELTKLTNPGPFVERTIDFGHYFGIFEKNKLVAMAGQRLHAFNYAEISAVCTHPEHTGKGYARQLLVHHINRIKAASEIPYLHARDDNERAISVYERLGFKKRTDVYFYVLIKKV